MRSYEKESALSHDRIHGIVKQRGAPSFFICDATCEALFTTPDLAGSELLEESKRLLGRLLREDEPSRECFEVLNTNTVLRIVPLAGGGLGHFAVVFERLTDRNSVEAAAKLYDLTKRESEVLGLILRGLSTLQIAESLYISDGTVGDHLKSLFRKTKTNRRSALVAQLFFTE